MIDRGFLLCREEKREEKAKEKEEGKFVLKFFEGFELEQSCNYSVFV